MSNDNIIENLLIESLKEVRFDIAEIIEQTLDRFTNNDALNKPKHLFTFAYLMMLNSLTQIYANCRTLKDSNACRGDMEMILLDLHRFLFKDVYVFVEAVESELGKRDPVTREEMGSVLKRISDASVKKLFDFY